MAQVTFASPSMPDSNQVEGTGTTTGYSAVVYVTGRTYVMRVMLATSNRTVSAVSDTGSNTWTRQVQQQMTGTTWPRIEIWTCIPSSGTRDITINFGGLVTEYHVQLDEISNADATTPVSATGSNAQSSSTTSHAMAGSSLTVPAEGLVLGVCGWNAGPGTLTTTFAQGWGASAGGGTNGSRMLSLSSAGGTTTNGAITSSISRTSAGGMIVYQPTVSGGASLAGQLLLLGVGA